MTEGDSMDLFGNEIDVFKSAKDRYGTWPLTVWECDKSDPVMQQLKRTINDTADDTANGMGIRKNMNSLMSTGKNSCYGRPGSTVHVSVFDPAVCTWIMNCFAPQHGMCFDPFAGGGTRAIIASKFGLAYLGVEIRNEECEAIKARLREARTQDFAHIVCGDARDCSQIASSQSADFLITCPPYWNLEQYDGGDSDLSMIDNYRVFCQELRKVISETHRILKPGAFSCWVVGLHRDNSGNLMTLQHDIAQMHRDIGFSLKEEIILSLKNNGAIQRVGNFDKGNRYLIRTHEYVLVFAR
jgi:DNA modification methylase